MSDEIPYHLYPGYDLNQDDSFWIKLVKHFCKIAGDLAVQDLTDEAEFKKSLDNCSTDPECHLALTTALRQFYNCKRAVRAKIHEEEYNKIVNYNKER